jgi:outer membrane receptor protein involved in Fe transport
MQTLQHPVWEEGMNQSTSTAQLSACALLLASSLAIPITASAQNAPDNNNQTSTPDTANMELGQVVVTAQKRSELLQSVPVSITAIDQQTLEHMGIESLSDLAREAPGLTVMSAGPGQNILVMRGISSTAGTAGTVGYYLDDTPISATSNASLLSQRGVIDPAVLDISRVEVLRGPQGTLYGSSSMGGTIKYVTNQPDFNGFSGRIDTTLSSTEGGGFNRAANGVLNMPINDNMAARVVVFYRYEDGYIDRYPINPNNYLGVAPGSAAKDNVNTEETAGIRAMLRMRFDGGWNITASIFHQTTLLGAPFTIDEPPGNLNDLIQTRLVAEPLYQDSTLSNLDIHKAFDNFELVSSTSFYNRSVQISEDSSKVLYYFYSPQQTYVYPSVMTGDYINHEFTQEIRLASTFDGPFQIIGGAFYHNVDAPLASQIPTPPGYNAAFGTNYGLIYAGGRQATVRELALFSEASYKITPSLTATVGGRAFRIDQGFAQQGDGVLNGGFTSVSGTSRDTGFNPKFNLAWQVDKDLLLYTTASKGYRQGGPNNPAPASVCGAQVATLGLSQSALEKFGADTLWNYEVGAKSMLLDHRLTIDGSLFYIDWSKVQQQIDLNCGFNITANFGSATSKGAELEITAKPTPELTLHAGTSFTEATLDNAVPGTDAVKGDTLLNVPRWSANVGGEYFAPFVNGYSHYERIDYTYVGSQYALYDPTSPFYRISGFGQTNLRIGLKKPKGGPGWDGSIFVDNLFNKIGETDLPEAISADLPTTRRIAITRPRTIGMTVRYQF